MREGEGRARERRRKLKEVTGEWRGRGEGGIEEGIIHVDVHRRDEMEQK